MRTALLAPDAPSPWTPPLLDALVNEFDADVHPVSPGSKIPDMREYDLVISRLKFKHLAGRATIDWSGSKALKVHWDEDGFWDGLWSDPLRRNLWSENFPRLGFDLLAVTGRRSEAYFRERGVLSIVVHKGFDGAGFRNLNRERRDSIVMYGQEYPSRILARRRLELERLPVVHLHVPFSRLADELNGHLAALSCTLDGRVLGGKRFLRAAQMFPQALIRTGPGPEPMLKFFESAASGCATFTDHTVDLSELGFVDGANAIIFSDVDELVDKAKFYMDQPDLLSAIGRRGAELCAREHTWDVRASQLRDRLAPYL